MNLINKIDEYLIKKEKRKRESHYPSEASKCLRQLYYKWTDYEESDPISAGGYWKMSMGSRIHEMVQEFLANSGLEIVDEVSFKKNIDVLEYPISGRIDNLFIDEDGVLAGIEIKTTYGAGVRALKYNGVKKEDLMQVLIYMSCTDVKRFYLIYVGRDDGYRTQYLIDYRNDVLCCDGKPLDLNFKLVIDKFRFLEACLVNNTIPKRDFKVAIKNGEIKTKFQKDKIEYKSDWQCSYCQYKTDCWREELILYSSSDNSETFSDCTGTS